MNLEAKVGIFVFIAILSMFGLTSQVAKFNLNDENGYELYSNIENATGLEKNAKVKVNGLDVGFVKNIQLDEDSKIKLTLFIDGEVKIPVDSIVSLSQSSMLGGKFIDIKPSNNVESLVENSELTQEKSYASFDKTSDTVNDTALEIKEFFKELRTTFNEDVRTDLQESISNIKNLTAKLDKVIDDNDDKVGETISNFNQLALDLSKAGKSFEIMSNKFASSADIVNNKLPSIAQNFENFSSEFDLVGKNINEQVPPILNKFSKLEDNLLEIFDENRKPLNSAIKSADKFFASGGSTFDKLDEYFSSMSKSEIEMAIRNEYMINDGKGKVFVSANYKPNPTKTYMLDVISASDYGLNDDNQINIPQKHEDTRTLISAQFAKRYRDLQFRVGLIENTGGVGVDYFSKRDKFKTSFELFDFNAVNDARGDNIHAKLSLRYNPLNYVDLFVGIDNILNDDARNLFLGAGVRFIDKDIKTLIGSAGSSFIK
jgi:phospholipid/cholesterol/gamma-HCH transport system substrate-binding protein